MQLPALAGGRLSCKIHIAAVDSQVRRERAGLTGENICSQIYAPLARVVQANLNALAVEEDGDVGCPVEIAHVEVLSGGSRVDVTRHGGSRGPDAVREQLHVWLLVFAVARVAAEKDGVVDLEEMAYLAVATKHVDVLEQEGRS